MKTILFLARLNLMLLLLAAANAPAAILSPLQNWGQTTYDPNTSLEWLDLNFTAGQSYNSVLAGWNGYTTTEGYRFATQTEVIQLFQHAGASTIGYPSGPVKAGDLEAANLTLSLLGITLAQAEQSRSWLLYDPATDPDLASPAHAPTAVVSVGVVRGGFPAEGVFLVPGLYPSRDYSTFEIASALVRVVPEPTTLSLILLGATARIIRRNWRPSGRGTYL